MKQYLARVASVCVYNVWYNFRVLGFEMNVKLKAIPITILKAVGERDLKPEGKPIHQHNRVLHVQYCCICCSIRNLSSLKNCYSSMFSDQEEFPTLASQKRLFYSHEQNSFSSLTVTSMNNHGDIHSGNESCTHSIGGAPPYTKIISLVPRRPASPSRDPCTSNM